MACSVENNTKEVSSLNPPRRILCSHCEKLLSPISEKIATKNFPDDTIIEVVERLLTKDDKKGILGIIHK